MSKKEIAISIIVIIFLIGGIIALSLGKIEEKETSPTQIEENTNIEGNSQEQKEEGGEMNQDVDQNNQSPKPPEMEIDANKTYQAILSTSAGEITINLSADKTPITVNNFVYLARKGFYNKTIFHRTMKDFMIQGGDPNGDGTGGPGYKFNDEPFEGSYERGIVAMANAGPNTNGSQFFIMHKDYNLPPNYVIFGQVSSGIEVVDKIAEAPVETSNSGESSKPVNPVTVESIEILEQ